MTFVGLLPSEVQLVVAGQLADDEITSAALTAAIEASDEDPCDGLRPVRRTAKD